MIYKSDIPGLNKLWFGPDYNLLKALDMKLLEEDEVPILYHNAYNVDQARTTAVFQQRPQIPEDHYAKFMRL